MLRDSLWSHLCKPSHHKVHTVHQVQSTISHYCWWFRKPARTLGCIKHLVNNGINYQPTSTGEFTGFLNHQLSMTFPDPIRANPFHLLSPSAPCGRFFFIKLKSAGFLWQEMLPWCTTKQKIRMILPTNASFHISIHFFVGCEHTTCRKHRFKKLHNLLRA